jgi:hypothetical protein
MTKRALVVGINDYHNWHRATPLRFRDLAFCRADATAFATLLTAFGFAEDHITLLEDGEATRQAILDGLRSLLQRSEAGDVVCFYYAGHGGRVPQNGWMVESDRHYETIVPYEGSMISDWELTGIAQSLELNRVNFTIVLDSCHSGGIIETQGDHAIRSYGWNDGLIELFTRGCHTIVPFICLRDPAALDNNVSNPQRANSGVRVAVDASKDLTHVARATLLSACNYDESAGESTRVGHGYFTQSILETVNQSNFEMSHTAFLAELRRKVMTLSGNSQTPQLRGRQIRLEENFLAGWTYSI